MIPDATARPLNVLLVSRALPPHVPGGLERHVADLALGLAEAGCRVHLLAAPLAPAARAPFEAAGITLHTANCAHPRRYTVRYLLRIGAQIDAIIRRHPIDLIHAQEFGLGCWRPPQGGPPLVLTVHGTITSETPLHPDVYTQLGPIGQARAWLRFGRRLAYAAIWRRALAAADRILVDSAFSRAELAHLVPDCLSRVRLAPLAVRETGPEPPSHEAARAALGWPPHHGQGGVVQLLTTGRLEWQKGHELALAALATLRHLDWHYTIAGAGQYARRIQQCIEKLGLGERVTLAGWVDEETKRQMLAGADLFLWPERTHPAFGLAGLESLLAGTPVLAARRGAIPEVLGEEPAEEARPDGEIRRVSGGWLVPPNDERALAQALEPILATPATLAGARAGLREAALKRFNFTRMIDAVLAAYRSL